MLHLSFICIFLFILNRNHPSPSPNTRPPKTKRRYPPSASEGFLERPVFLRFHRSCPIRQGQEIFQTLNPGHGRKTRFECSLVLKSLRQELGPERGPIGALY